MGRKRRKRRGMRRARSEVGLVERRCCRGGRGGGRTDLDGVRGIVWAWVGKMSSKMEMRMRRREKNRGGLDSSLYSYSFGVLLQDVKAIYKYKSNNVFWTAQVLLVHPT